MTHLMQNELADMSITPTRHYYAMTGFNIPLSGDVLILRNNILAKTDFNAGAVDFNVNVIYDDMLWAGFLETTRCCCIYNGIPIQND